MEGIASVSFDSPAQNGLQTSEEDSDGSDMLDKMEGGSSRPHSAVRWSGRSSQTHDLDVVCSGSGFKVTFLTSPLSDVSVLGMYLMLILPSKYLFEKCLLPLCSSPGTNELLDVTDALYCGYEVNHLMNTLDVPFTGCHVKHLATCNVSMDLSDPFNFTFTAHSCPLLNNGIRAGQHLHPAVPVQDRSSQNRYCSL